MSWGTLGALFAALGVAAGAFGAHGLAEALSADALGWWKTGAHYHVIHALALVVVGLSPRARPRSRTVAAVGFTAGIVLFAGSLYLMAVTDQRWLGAVTPLGGLGFLIGWVALARAHWRPPSGA